MDASRRAAGRAFCPRCGQKYAVPEQELKRHPGLRFRAVCRACQTPFSVRWQDDGMVTDTDEQEVADRPGEGRNVLPKGVRVGKYEIEEMLASGGSASVYKAFDLGANRRVALKVLHRAADSDYGVRFRREVEVQGNLKHPNLMPIFDQGSIDGKPYYTMELLHRPIALETIIGLFRSQRLAYNPALRTLASLDALLRRVLLPVTRAVEFTNRNGVIHRDLKPANVIVDARTLHVYVIDFGICHLFKKAGERLVLRAGEGDGDRDQSTRLRMGTSRFMPPEQARGEVSETGDVWALGALLYYILRGDAPIAPAIDTQRVSVGKRLKNLRKIMESSRAAGDEEEARFYERRIEELQGGSVRSMKDVLRDSQAGHYLPLPDGTDPELGAIALRAMSVAPRDRYRSADAFGQDVLRYLEGRPVRAYLQQLGPGRALLYKTRLQVQRNRSPVLVGVAALLVGVVLIVFLLLKAASDRQDRIDRWVAEARASSDPVLQEDRLTKALALQPEHAQAARLLALARKYIPIREKLKNARAARRKVDALRSRKLFDAAARLSEDTAAVLEGSVLPDLLSLPDDYPGRRDEKSVQGLADFLRGRRVVTLKGIPRGVEVTLVFSRSLRDPALLWEQGRDWGRAPLSVPEHVLESGSYVIVFSRGSGPAVHVPFLITHETPQRLELRCPLDPGRLPEGMIYVEGVRRMRFGDLRFRETTRRVTLAPFLLDQYEVTNRQYAAYLNALEPGLRRRAVPRRLLPGPGENTTPLWTEGEDRTWSYPEGTADQPVTSISSLDAAAYAAAAGKRLPTPEEWEHAARGVDGRDYPFGAKLDPEACNAATGVLADFGDHPLDRAPYGAFNMGGNAAEWTGPPGGEMATVKGGSFDLPRYRVIVTSFGRRRADLPYPDVGFRCAKSTEAGTKPH